MPETLTQPDEYLRRARQADQQHLTTYLTTYADALPAARHDQPLTPADIDQAFEAAARTLDDLPEMLRPDYALRGARALPVTYPGITVGEYRVLVLGAARRAAQ
ncbi:hypothetical protein [Streptomyces chumphonensis]|uniref:hypothetical protein n=1 Tax=Streptomyces chumphonensis TaxID=1214925 RepID=UPI003D70F578